MYADLRRSLRTIVASAAVVCYGMPLGISVAADFAHGVEHLGAKVGEQHRLATALGLVHAADKVRTQATGRARAETGQGALTHSHGGSTHAHGPTVAVFVDAGDASNDGESQDRGLVPNHAPHVVPAYRVAVLEAPIASPGFLLCGDLESLPRGAPIPPPPRA